MHRGLNAFAFRTAATSSYGSAAIVGTAIANYLQAAMAFDGKNIFSYCEENTWGQDVIWRLSMDAFNGTIMADAIALQVRYYGFDDDNAACNALIDHSGRLVWDGDSVWACIDNRAAQTYSGIVRRIPRTAVRG
jgi:hypothetical protein